MMKYPYAIIAIISILSGTLSSCNNDDEQCGAGTAPLQVHATIHSTVIAKRTFVQDDCIGIYLVDYVDGQPGVLGDVNQTTAFNVEYALDPTGYWYGKDGTDLFVNDTPSDLYTYHPYDEEMSREPGKSNLTAYPFAVDTDQQTAGGEPSDFLWAKITGLTTTNFTAPIVFHHLMCRAEINIQLAEGVETSATPTLHVINTQTECTINLRNGQVTPAGAATPVLPALNTVTTPDYDYTYDAIIVPQTLAGGTPFITIRLNGEAFVFNLPADLVMLPQECYKFNLVAGLPSARSEGNHTLTIERITDNR